MTGPKSNNKPQQGDIFCAEPPLADEDPWASLKAAMSRGVSEDFLADGREQPDYQESPAVFPDECVMVAF